MSWTKNIYYILIGVISLIMLVFMPMLGSVAGIQWNFPTTAAGWLVYVLTKISAAGFNISLFHCFVCQGKENAKESPKFAEAQAILQLVDNKLVNHPRTPSQFYRETYGKKGITIFLTTLAGSVGLSQAILSFNVTEFITQFVTMVVGLIFGIMQMKTTEEYWTQEYLDFAKEKQKCLNGTEQSSETCKSK